MEKHKALLTPEDQYDWSQITLQQASDIRYVIERGKLQSPTQHSLNGIFGNLNHCHISGDVCLDMHWNDEMQRWSATLVIGEDRVDFFHEYFYCLKMIQYVEHSFESNLKSSVK